MRLTSRTIFFFAFQWKTDGGFSKVRAAATSSGWQSSNPAATFQFSQTNYFHDFARGAIFDVSGTPVVSNFQKKIDLPFKIEVQNAGIQRQPDDGTTTFSPIATFATLDIYEAGVGIFSLTLDCPENSVQPDDLLAINDLGRRLYPQTLNQGGVALAQSRGLIPVNVGTENDLEDFSAFQVDMVKGEKLPQKFLPKYLRQLLGSHFKTQPEEVKSEDVLIENALDDRMFVLSCLLQNQPLNVDYDYLTDDFWYKFVFVDGGSISVKNQMMQRDLISAATYPRWLDDRTIYGASRYSFVALIKDGGLFGPMTGNYNHLVKLCLAQRAAVLRFRDDATQISKSIATDTAQIAEKIRRLHGEFIRFSNRLNFREVSTQEQGIELYDLIRRQMRVQEQVDALKEELAELHDYAIQLNEASRSRAIEWLTILGAVFLVPSFLLSYFGFFESWKKHWEQCHLLLFWSVVGGAVLAIGVFFSGLLRDKGIRRNTGIAILLIFLVYALALPLLMEWFPQWFGIQKN